MSLPLLLFHAINLQQQTCCVKFLQCSGFKNAEAICSNFITKSSLEKRLSGHAIQKGIFGSTSLRCQMHLSKNGIPYFECFEMFEKK